MYTDTSKSTSFIPKAPVTSIQTPTSISGAVSTEGGAKHKMGFLGWLSVLILVATLLSGIGVLLYLGYNNSQRDQIISSIKKKRELVDPAFIVDAQRLSARIAHTKELLDKQIYITPLFESLEKTTLKSVQFDSFALVEDTTTISTEHTSGRYQAVLKGKARSYEVIAQQSDVFAKDPVLKTHFFSGFKIDKEKSLVSFTLTVDLPEKLGHDRFLPVLSPASPGLDEVVNTSLESGSETIQNTDGANVETGDPGAGNITP